MNTITLCFTTILLMSVVSSLLIVIILLIRKYSYNYINKKFFYYLWIIVLFFSTFPVSNFYSNKNDNLIDQKQEIEDKEQELENSLDVNYDIEEIEWKKEKENKPEKKEKFLLKEKLILLINNTVNSSLFLTIIKLSSVIWIMGIFFLNSYRILICKKFKKELHKAELFSINIVMLEKEKQKEKIIISEAYAKRVYQIMVEQAKQLKIHKIPEAFFHSDISSPLLTGFIFRKIYLPTEEIPKEELTVILKHELIHTKRYDLFYQFIANLILSFHWFNPLIWKMVSCIEEDCEFSCDEDVIFSMEKDKRKIYSKAILMVLYRAKQKNIVGNVALNKKKSLTERRVRKIMEEKKSRKNGYIFICSLITIFIFCSGFMTSAIILKSKAIKKEQLILENQETVQKQIRTKTNSATSFSKEFQNVKKLDVNAYNAKITLEEGEKFFVEAKNIEKDYKIELKNDTLHMYTNKNINNSSYQNYNHYNKYNNKATIKIVIPKNYLLDLASFDVNRSLEIKKLQTVELTIDSSYGTVSLDSISAKRTFLDSGSGAVHWNNSSLGKTTIDSGSGVVSMENVKLENLYLDSGPGNVMIAGELKGKNIIDSGSGPVTISPYGTKQEYMFQIDNGSGGIWIDGEKYKDGYLNRNITENSFNINGGSGAIHFNFSQKNVKYQEENQIINTIEQKTKNQDSINIELKYPTIGKDYINALNLDKNKIITTQTSTLDNINQIYLNFAYSSVYFYSTDENKITLIQSYPKNSKKPNWSLKEKEIVKLSLQNDILTAKTQSLQRKNTFNREGTDIFVFLPKSFKKDISVYSSLGDLVFYHPLECNNLEATLSLGDIVTKDKLVVKNFSTNCNLGNIFFEKPIYCTNFSVENSLGNCEINDMLNCSKMDINVNLGNCTIKKDVKCDEINIQVDMGNLNAKKLEAKTKNIDTGFNEDNCF